MKELLEYLKINHEDNDQIKLASELLEYLYFTFINTSFKSLDGVKNIK